jgi:hypothetical protein
MIVLIDDNSPKGLHIYRVHEGNPKLLYYNNTLDNYTLNTPLKCNVNGMTLHLKSSQNTYN